ncbi:hypothetical protein SBADM41S_10783 [Streptomyces badius]
MTPGVNEQPALQAQGALVVQQVLVPVADHVLGDDDRRPRRAGDSRRRLLTYSMTGRVTSRYGESRTLSGTSMPRRSHSSRRAFVSAGSTLTVSASGRSARTSLGVGEGAQRGTVDLGDQDDRVDAGGAPCRRSGPPRGPGGRDLLGDTVVVLADRRHRREEDAHPQQGDPGAVGELRGQDHDQHEPGEEGAEGVDRAGADHAAAGGLVALGGQEAVPVPDHADLAEREGHEDADDVELDQPGRVGAVDDDQEHRRAGQEHDAVGEGQAVAAGVQLTRQVAVLGEDRAEQREAVVGGVGGEEEDQGGGGGEDDEEEGAVAEDRLGDLGDDRVLGVVRADRRRRRG